MNVRLGLAAAASLTILVAPLASIADPTPAPTAAPSAAPPISIDVCQLRTTSDGPFVSNTDGVEIKFTNESKLVATTIEFAVASGAQSGVIRDVGSFAPGLEITHDYREGSGFQIISPLFSHPHLTCSVQSVAFSDGSTWQPAAAASPSPSAAVTDGALSAIPATLVFSAVGSTYDQFLSVADAVAGASLKETDNCAQIATVTVVASSASGQSLRVSPVGSGYCAVHITDGSNLSVMVPVQVAPKN